MFRNRCLVCNSTNLSEIVNLGMHPFADSFIPVERESLPDKLYPLIVDMCNLCKHIQLRTVTSAEDRYQELDYSYTSANSATSRAHWNAYPSEVLSRLPIPSLVKTVLEIGSNDGYLCNQFKILDKDVIGVDASPAMVELARQAGVECYCGIFDKTLVIPHSFDLIVANNVFNHSDNPMAFVRGVVNKLNKGGTFVFELPYWMSSVMDFKFDQIYHEHVSYFTVTGAANLFARFGLNVSHVDLVDYHGGSIRVFVSERKPDESVRRFIDQEREAALFNEATYDHFQRTIEETRNYILGDITDIRTARPDASIICVGAAAKGNTFLNFYRLDNSLIDYVTDASPYKIGKLTPGTRIPIVADGILAGLDAPHVIITSWNLSNTLRQKLLKINPRIHFINPFA